MNEKPRPTLQTIADIAGISKMSVSRCLRNHPNNSVETRERVRKIAEEIGYRPHPLVSSLMQEIRTKRKSTHSGMVLAVLDDFVGPRPDQMAISWKEHMDGIRNRADELGYGVEIIRYKEQSLSEERLVRILWSRNIRGIIIPYHYQLLELQDSHLSCFAAVSLGYTLVTPPLDRVCPDFYGGMTLALDEIRERGYSRVVYVTEHRSLPRNHGKLAASFLFRKSSNRGKMDMKLCTSIEKEGEKILKWIERQQPEVVVSEHHRVYGVLKGAGYSIPRDLAFVQMNWTPAFSPCSGVKNRNHLQGEIAVNLLNSKLTTNDFGIPKDPITHLVKNRWVEGESLPSLVEPTS